MLENLDGADFVDKIGFGWPVDCKTVREGRCFAALAALIVQLQVRGHQPSTDDVDIWIFVHSMCVAFGRIHLDLSPQFSV